jgi:response regulator RpfG family c-di-GMP phosphodiesterase
MTAASDSDLVIELINQAQIFRFLNKPLKLPTLQQHVVAAMAQFSKYKAQPKLLLNQQVAKPKTGEAEAEAKASEESGVGKLIMGTLRALRFRLSGN